MSKAFGVLKEPRYASEYTRETKEKQEECTHFNRRIKKYRDVGINTANLYVNLLSKENLLGVPVVSTASDNISPALVDVTKNPFYSYYTIDPQGRLFGNTLCGQNNYVHYLQFSPQTSK